MCNGDLAVTMNPSMRSIAPFDIGELEYGIASHFHLALFRHNFR
jgi:hypothetical protein